MVNADTIRVYKKDEVYNLIECEPGISQELTDFFTFEVPGFRYMPAYRNKQWDGKIRLFNQYKAELYSGLLHHLKEFANDRKYHVECDSTLKLFELNYSTTEKIIDKFSIPLEVRDYQIDAVKVALSNKRVILLSPTASGKSLIIYSLVRSYQDMNNKQILIVVPTTTLVEQMYKDFNDYALNIQWASEDNCHLIYSGKEKSTQKPIIISTWQSIHRLPKSFFENIGMVIGDEAHNFKAKSLTSIMTKLVNCEYRIGTTGTLDGTQTHKLVLEGLFGPVYNVITTKELMEEDYLANLSIHCVVLKHDDQISKVVKTLDYQGEIDYLVRNEDRNQFIVDLVEELRGNTLVLYQLVEKHGEVLYNMIEENSDKDVKFVHGGVSTDEREVIRLDTEKGESTILVASYGTYSTGINIRNLHNVVFASPSKSRIRNLQSIGRALRRTNEKSTARLFDIADDLSVKNYQNYTLKHFIERMGIYDSERFDYDISKINL
jgi:superfamily II DNA or RNA helicase